MSLTLMLIDDSLTARMTGRAVVQHACPDWTVLLAKDGDDALTQAQDGAAPIDHFLVDVNLPGLNGTELAEHLRALFPEAGMAFMTANTQAHVREKAAALGMAVVGKPLTLEKFNTLLTQGFAAHG